MLKKWMKSRRLLVAVGIAVASWATFQTDVIASGEFLTDRIGEGSILRVSQDIHPEFGGRYVFFQDGRPTHLAQVKVDRPYCRFARADGKMLNLLGQNHKLVVRFRNVARARWFFDGGAELECVSPHEHESIRESDFHQALGRYFQIEKHSLSKPEPAQWSAENAV